MATLTRLVRSVSGRNIVAATIIEHPDTIKANEAAAAAAAEKAKENPEPLEKINEATPADGGGKKKNKGKNKQKGAGR